MPHINTSPGDHDLTVSFFIIRTDTPEPTLMMHKHKKMGKWMMFGGHVERHENPWEAALHETTEETGYFHTQLKVLQPNYRIPQLEGAVVHPTPLCVSTGNYPGTENLHYHTDIMYAFIASENPAGIPDDGESADIQCFTLEQIKAMSPEETVTSFQQMGIAILEHYFSEWKQVEFTEFQKESSLSFS